MGGGLEFCSSMQWTACSLILANHYSLDPAKFAASIATLTLASTCGTLTAKAGGTALLHIFNDWRVVARIGASAALAGSLIVRSLTSEHPNNVNSKKNAKEENKLSMNAVKLSIKNVLGSKIFWLAGLAHATALMTRSADRVLGSFVLEATNLPRKFCGGLTASMTVGFLLGLSNTRKFYEKPDTKSKTFSRKEIFWGSSLSAWSGVMWKPKSSQRLYSFENNSRWNNCTACGIYVLQLKFPSLPNSSDGCQHVV